MIDLNAWLREKAKKTEAGVTYLSDPQRFTEFEDLFAKVQSKEGREYPDATLRILPYVDAKDPLSGEWEMRQQSLYSFLRFVGTKPLPANLLDVGCGTGWFSAFLAKINGMNVYAVDVQKKAMEQGAKVFKLDRLHFVYGDIFEDIFPEKSFPLITLSGSIQYFDNLEKLINRMFYFLEPGGEIHIVDSPLDSKSGDPGSIKKTQKVYDALGLSGMSKFHFHHGWDAIEKRKHTVMYKPKGGLSKMFGKKENPLCWVRILT